MNLKSRIKKLEKTANVGGFCLCYGKVEHPCIADFSDGKYEVTPIPDFCDKCQRQVDKSGVKFSLEEYEAKTADRVKQAAETMAMFED